MLLLVLFAQMQAVLQSYPDNHQPDENVLHLMSLWLKHYLMLLGKQTDALLNLQKKKNVCRDSHLNFGPFRKRVNAEGERVHGEKAFF